MKKRELLKGQVVVLGSITYGNAALGRAVSSHVKAAALPLVDHGLQIPYSLPSAPLTTALLTSAALPTLRLPFWSMVTVALPGA